MIWEDLTELPIYIDIGEYTIFRNKDLKDLECAYRELHAIWLKYFSHILWVNFYDTF